MLLLLATLCTSGALAVEPGAEQAEAQRLVEHVRTLAGKNAWAGVSRTYAELHELQPELPCDVHVLGAQGALQAGDMWAAYQRFERAHDCAPQAGHDGDLDRIDEGFGRAIVEFPAKKHAPLEPVQMPFEPDKRKVILHAQESSDGERRYQGMLPAGTYRVGGLQFDVKPGPWFQTVVVPKE